MITNDQMDQKKQAVANCVAEFKIDANPAITDEVISYEGFPSRSSKTLACLVLSYQREATTTELKKVSDQPASLIRNLRQAGFIFKGDGDNYYYKNENGETCRKIIGYDTPAVVIRGNTKEIIEKSLAACVSAIEIYNKPDFKYREETFAILLINAWELLLKAKIVLDNNNRVRSIFVIKKGVIKESRSGNPLTIDIYKAMNKLNVEGKLDRRCLENVKLLIEVRDNAIHYVNKGLHFSKKAQEIGTASLRNYITVIYEWFELDLSQYNFFLMPMSFFYPTSVDAFSVNSPNEEIQNLLKYFHHVESQYPVVEDEIPTYNITLQIETKFVKIKADDSVLPIRYTDDPGAPEIKVSEEHIIDTKYPLSYRQLVTRLRERYTDFKQNQQFYTIKRELENYERHGDKYCKSRYLDPRTKTGTKKVFYSTEIIREFDKHYTKKQ